MDINVQNFDSGAMAFVDDNEYSNFSVMSMGMTKEEAQRKVIEDYLSRPRKINTNTDKLVEVKAKLGFRPNPRQQMWISAFRKKNQEVNALSQKLKIAILQGNKSQKNAYESQIQAILTELKQLKAQNEELLKKNSQEAIPKEILAEQEVSKSTPYDKVPANIDSSAPVKSIGEKIDVAETMIVEEIESAPKKSNWLIPALGIGVIAYLILRR